MMAVFDALTLTEFTILYPNLRWCTRFLFQSEIKVNKSLLIWKSRSQNLEEERTSTRSKLLKVRFCYSLTIKCNMSDDFRALHATWALVTPQQLIVLNIWHRIQFNTCATITPCNVCKIKPRHCVTSCYCRSVFPHHIIRRASKATKCVAVLSFMEEKKLP